MLRKGKAGMTQQPTPPPAAERRLVPSTPVILTANPGLKLPSLKNSNQVHRFSYEDYVTDAGGQKRREANHRQSLSKK